MALVNDFGRYGRLQRHDLHFFGSSPAAIMAFHFQNGRHGANRHFNKVSY
jgi:hypothetical protein